MDNQKELHEINIYCNPSSLLVVQITGELIRVYCPFRVLVLRSVGNFKTGSELQVTQVKVDAKLLLVYIINNKGYYYWDFTILL